MGKFINTGYTDTLNKIGEVSSTLINNPYPMWSDKKATPVTYYHINADRSTLDEAGKFIYSDLTINCPLRYDEIKDMVIYGFDRISMNLVNDEEGLLSEDITGDAQILPDTISPPYPGDYFIPENTPNKYLFRINDVQQDTLYNGSNYYKISYKLEHSDISMMDPLINEEYKFIVSNIGTNYTPILKKTSYDLVTNLDNIAIILKKYFNSLFYRPQVQTFIFCRWGDDYFYDPYMIEFLIRNSILSGGDDYIYIDHKIAPIKTFAIDYTKTIFSAVEDKDIRKLLKAKVDSTANYIEDYASIFASRVEHYFRMNYLVASYNTRNTDSDFYNPIITIPHELLVKAANNDLYTIAEIQMNPILLFHNLLIKYFNDTELTISDFNFLEDIEFCDDMPFFYMIPLMIFIIEYYEKIELSKRNSSMDAGDQRILDLLNAGATC